jgi:hypothetical protein
VLADEGVMSKVERWLGGHGRASAFENWCRLVENGNLNYRTHIARISLHAHDRGLRQKDGA